MNNSFIRKEIDSAELIKIAKDLFGNSTTVVASKLLKGGMFNTTYYVKTDNDDEIVIRIAPVDKRLLFNFEKDMMSAEPIFHKLLHNNGVKTSNILKYSPFGEVIEREYIVSRYIKAIPMNHPSLKLRPLTNVYREAGYLTAKMHSIKIEKFGWLREGGASCLFDTWFEFTAFFSGEIADKLESNNLFKISDIKLFRDIVIGAKDILNEITEPHMTHTDLWQGNILVDKNRGKYQFAAIIDLDRTIFGDECWDLASPWMINKPFLNGYGKNPYTGEKQKNRMDLYRLISSLFSCYVRLIEYKDEKTFNKEKKLTLKALYNYTRQ
jgi:aminoglycoside phosphotransferase (APT) family kinase protein